MADPLSAAGTAVGVISLGIQVAQSLYTYYCDIRSQYADTADTLTRLEDLLELLKCLHEQLVNRRPRPKNQTLIDRINIEMKYCEELIYGLEEEAAKFQRTDQKNIKSLIQLASRQAAYPFRKGTLAKLNGDIDDIRSQLNFALQILQQKTIDRTEDEVEELKALVDLIRASQVSSELESWLKAPDATINFNEAYRKKHPRTGLWLVDGSPFEAWLQRAYSLLWVRGFAGSGKSVLCSTAIQHAFRHRRSSSRIGLAFFFFTFNDENKQGASSMLRALISQLSTQLGVCTELEHLQKRYSHATPPNEALQDCLHQIVRKFDHVYILGDALDESPRGGNRDAVLDVITEVRAWKEERLHLFLTSRDEPDIREALEIGPDEIIEMSNDEVHRDIRNFISQRLRTDRRLKKWEKYHDKIQDALARKAGGVFRWVECQFKTLQDCPPNEDLLEGLLESLPRSLDETYARMLRSIPEKLRDYASQLLTILSCAHEPLTASQMLDALSFEFGASPRYNPKRRFEDPSALQAICPGFIGIISNPRGPTVQIAHYSVLEYLRSERILEQRDISHYHIEQKGAHTNMARLCLALLLEPHILKLVNVKFIKGVRDIENQYPLASYAAYAVDEQIMGLFHDTNRAYKIWKKGVIIDHPMLMQCDAVSTAAGNNLVKALRQLLAEAATAPSGHTHKAQREPPTRRAKVQDLVNYMHHKTPLHVAAREGCYDAACVPPSNYDRVTALHLALLLDKGADIDIRDGKGETALIYASRRNNRDVVELLLRRGAHVNIANYWGDTALLVGAERADHEVVRILLDGGADVRHCNCSHQTALHLATYLDPNRDTVQILIDRGAELNLTTARQNEEVVRLLLDSGADVNIYDSRSGNLGVIRLLLESGADVNFCDSRGLTALLAAASRRNPKIAQLLLESGADTALMEAAKEGKEEIVQLLLDRGADVNTQKSFAKEYNYFREELLAAVEQKDQAMAKQFLDMGADVNCLGSEEQTVLRLAFWREDHGMVKLLEEYGARAPEGGLPAWREERSKELDRRFKEWRREWKKEMAEQKVKAKEAGEWWALEESQSSEVSEDE
ncbi:ankyrin repeat-containing protein [Xylariaceae sp. FL0594]|nr:ankyrin repeat-containing protein [Xylariaceae sp. FL0594]